MYFDFFGMQYGNVEFLWFSKSIPSLYIFGPLIKGIDFGTFYKNNVLYSDSKQSFLFES